MSNKVFCFVSNVKVGDRVLPPLYALTWRERPVIPAHQTLHVYFRPGSIEVSRLQRFPRRCQSGLQPDPTFLA